MTHKAIINTAWADLLLDYISLKKNLFLDIFLRRPQLFSSSSSSWILLFLLVSALFVLFSFCFYQRNRAKKILESSSLPIVFWTPRFIHYSPPSMMIHSTTTTTATANIPSTSSDTVVHKDSKLPSSNITNILPRMEQLGGPYGMYATVYGISTMVIHMAHPIPIQCILLEEKYTRREFKDDHSPRCSSTSISSTVRSFISTIGQITPRHLFHIITQTLFTFTPSSISDHNYHRTSSTKEPAYNHFKNFSGQGVFTSDGTIWKDKRISVIHCLLRGMYDPISTGDSMTRLELEANRAAESFLFQINSTNSNCSVFKSSDKYDLWNIVPILQRSTIGLIYRYITHHNVDMYPPSSSTSSPKDTTTKTGDNIKQPYQLLDTYLQAVTDIRMIILAQSRSVWFLLPRWVYRWFAPMHQQEGKIMSPIRAFAHMTCSYAKPESPLGMLRQRSSHKNHSLFLQQRGDNETKIIGNEILDEAITILFAGQDTSAATLSWAIHLLSLYPDTQQRLYHEICNVVEMEYNINVPNHKDNNDDDNNHYTTIKDKKKVPFTGKMISRMTYLDAVIKETMRLYPAAPFIVRRLQEVITVPMDGNSHSSSIKSNGGSYTLLPKDSFACIWIYSVHRNSKLWNRPHDFLPERWIDSNLREKDLGQRMSGSYIPFAAGPRNCLGQPLAHIILRIMLAKIIYNCDMMDPRVAFSEKEKINIAHTEITTDRNCTLRTDMQAGFTILPLGGVHVQIHPRQ